MFCNTKLIGVDCFHVRRVGAQECLLLKIKAANSHAVIMR
jgi:hypothetical protein